MAERRVTPGSLRVRLPGAWLCTVFTRRGEGGVSVVGPGACKPARVIRVTAPCCDRTAGRLWAGDPLGRGPPGPEPSPHAVQDRWSQRCRRRRGVGSSGQPTSRLDPTVSTGCGHRHLAGVRAAGEEAGTGARPGLPASCAPRGEQLCAARPVYPAKHSTPSHLPLPTATAKEEPGALLVSRWHRKHSF